MKCSWPREKDKAKSPPEQEMADLGLGGQVGILKEDHEDARREYGQGHHGNYV